MVQAREVLFYRIENYMVYCGVSTNYYYWWKYWVILDSITLLRRKYKHVLVLNISQSFFFCSLVKAFLVIDRSFLLLLRDNELDTFLRVFLTEGPAVYSWLSNQRIKIVW